MQTRERQLGLSNLGKELIRHASDDVDMELDIETPATPEA